MAGDWIKMQTNLLTHPKVVRMASALKTDRFRIIGGLMSVWSLFDAHSEDGRLSGYTTETLDEMAAWLGFSAAMMAVEWLQVDGESLVLPSFESHNGASSKRRAQDADRKRVLRKESGSYADKKRTREEKNREEKKEGSANAKPASRAVEIDTWLDSLPEGCDPIAADDPIVAYAEKTGIPLSFLDLAWDSFSAAYRAKHKRQKDWPGTFGNAVRGNWYKLWWFTPDGKCQLTTPGEQAKRAAA